MTIIDTSIRLTGFSKSNLPELVFDIDKKILKKLVIIEKICKKLLFSLKIRLDWTNHSQFKATYNVNYKII